MGSNFQIARLNLASLGFGEHERNDPAVP